MKNISILGLFLLMNVNVMVAQWTDYRSSSALSTQNANSRISSVVCKQPGLTCGSDCVSVYLCTNTGHGYFPVLADTCKYGMTCSAGKCSIVPSLQCSTGAMYPFICNSLDGVYPDPADCKKYHYCVPNTGSVGKSLTHVEATCPSGYAYNALTTYCDIQMKEGNDYRIPVCIYPAQTGVVGLNPSMYYICLLYSNESNVLYPFLYICPHGQIYNGNYACEERILTTTTNNTITSSAIAE